MKTDKEIKQELSKLSKKQLKGQIRDCNDVVGDLTTLSKSNAFALEDLKKITRLLKLLKTELKERPLWDTKKRG